MFEAATKISWRDAHAADHPFNDVAVMAKQAPRGSAVVAVVGSNLSPIKGTGADSAAPVLQSKHFRSGCRIHAGSSFPLAVGTGLSFLWRVAGNGCGTLGGMASALNGILTSLNLGLVAVGFCFRTLLRVLLVGGPLPLPLALNVGDAPSLVLRLVSCPLFFRAIRFLHQTTPIFHTSSLIAHPVQNPHAHA